jgi:hypothetical protein
MMIDTKLSSPQRMVIDLERAPPTVDNTHYIKRIPAGINYLKKNSADQQPGARPTPNWLAVVTTTASLELQLLSNL